MKNLVARAVKRQNQSLDSVKTDLEAFLGPQIGLATGEQVQQKMLTVYLERLVELVETDCELIKLLVEQCDSRDVPLRFLDLQDRFFVEFIGKI